MTWRTNVSCKILGWSCKNTRSSLLNKSLCLFNSPTTTPCTLQLSCSLYYVKCVECQIWLWMFVHLMESPEAPLVFLSRSKGRDEASVFDALGKTTRWVTVDRRGSRRSWSTYTSFLNFFFRSLGVHYKWSASKVQGTDFQTSEWYQWSHLTLNTRAI